MEKLCERVEREYKEWNERYIIPHDEEFLVKTLLKLQNEYDNTGCNSSTTLTRRNLLDMIVKLQNNLDLKKKMKKNDKCNVLIVCNRSFIRNLTNFLMMIIDKDNIKSTHRTPNYDELKLLNDVTITIVGKDYIDGCSGMRIQRYFNFTGDNNIENKLRNLIV